MITGRVRGDLLVSRHETGTPSLIVRTRRIWRRCCSSTVRSALSASMSIYGIRTTTSPVTMSSLALLFNDGRGSGQTPGQLRRVEPVRVWTALGLSCPDWSGAEDRQPGPLRDLVGYRLLNFDGMRPDLTVHAGGHDVVTWAESYEPTNGTSLFNYDDGPLAGQAAVVQKDNVFSIGAWSTLLIADVLSQVFTRAGIPIVSLPEGMGVSRRGAAVIWMNFNQDGASLPDGTQLGPVSFQIRSSCPDFCRRGGRPKISRPALSAPGALLASPRQTSTPSRVARSSLRPPRFRHCDC
jgi:hypothetical protein